MQVCYESYNLVEAQFAATFLREHEVPVQVINEASFVLGYAGVCGPATLLVPDALAEKARGLLAGANDGPELPDDPEYVYEGAAPPSISPLELGISAEFLFGRMAFIFVALMVLLLLMFAAVFAFPHLFV